MNAKSFHGTPRLNEVVVNGGIETRWQTPVYSTEVEARISGYGWSYWLDGARHERLTDEQLQSLRRHAANEGKDDLANACDEAAFSGCKKSMKRCTDAFYMRSLQAVNS